MSPVLSFLDRRPALWLLLGATLVAASQIRWPVAALGWFVAVPFLRFLRLRPGRGPLIGLVGAVVAGWTLATLTIVTAPLPLGLGIGFGVPIGLFAALPYMVLGLRFDRLGPARRVLLFTLLATSAEWLQRNGTPLLSWGAAAYNQLDNAPLLQLASVLGLAGPALLVHGAGALIEALLAGEGPRIRTLTIAGALTLLVVHAAGSTRIAAYASTGRDAVVAAAVGTLADIDGSSVPSPEAVAGWDDALWSRTRAAAAAGAEIVVWTEAATVVEPDAEAAFQARLADLAAEVGVQLVAAYVVPITWSPLQFENKYAWFGPDGALRDEYLKREPVPGEPAVRGTGPAGVVTHAGARLSGAICYDYDAPDVAWEHAHADVDLVALPSSDWRGIDPVHTRMAALRAIEGGHSILRSTRFGLSAGIDPLGRIRAARSAFDGSDPGVLIAALPRHGVRTVYSRLGETGVGLLLLLGLIALAGAHRYAPGHAARRPHDPRPTGAGGVPRPGPGR
jgi:apolipoprotein N-acyltransferase